MAISKSDYTIFNKELPTIKNTLNSYFGVDVELIKEISKRMNFTPEILQPSDDMAYGFRVRIFKYLFLILKIWINFIWS